MKIIIVGATGTIGKAVVKSLQDKHEIISVGHSQGYYKLDISDVEQIKSMFKAIGNFDALISTTGSVHFASLSEFTDPSKWQVGLNNKLMGQVNLVMQGLDYINGHGSFTLTSGLLNKDPIKYGANAAMVNGALEGFVTAAAIEMPRQTRINIVSPNVLKESMPKYEAYFQGFLPVAAKDVSQAYVKSVEGLQTGQTYKVGW